MINYTELAQTGLTNTVSSYTRIQMLRDLGSLLRSLTADGKRLDIKKVLLEVDCTVEKVTTTGQKTIYIPTLVRAETGVSLTQGETDTRLIREALDAALDTDFEYFELPSIIMKGIGSVSTGNVLEQGRRTYDLTKVCRKYAKSFLSRIIHPATTHPVFLILHTMTSSTETVRIRHYLKVEYESHENSQQSF